MAFLLSFLSDLDSDEKQSWKGEYNAFVINIL